ncbi:MAG: hypothetical protein COB59_00095 [Rhodospirillaceae bacterium]|nr:MAG: hypothetical protein COB59_00095 [Rhodospirillaceae bacterium]
MFKKSLAPLALALAFFTTPALAQDAALVTSKSLSPDTAHALVKQTLEACRSEGFQVAVVVIDRGGNLQALIRDQFAGPFTPKVAELKAATALNFSTNTQTLMEQTQPGSPASGLRHVPGVLVVGGGVLIQAGGTLIGAIGVSGAPGGDADEACALKGLESIQDDLDFL